jgi:hypothetical protein
MKLKIQLYQVGDYFILKKILVPGPGAYRSFSEWGVYESKNANQASSSTAPNEM